MDWIHICFFSLPEGNCICLFGVQRQHISGEEMNDSLSSHQSHQPTGVPLTARSRRAEKERMGKESVSEEPGQAQMWRGLCFLDQFSWVTSSLARQQLANGERAFMPDSITSCVRKQASTHL